MARKLRLEFPGAIYHVINRGNYRAWLFKTEGSRRAFEDCLFDACARSEWRLHAFVVMGNHFHLAVETPLGNLVAGMQWMQSTFANRFNKMRGERGHLFQGRYKSLVVEEGPALGMVCDYIHLNPVRAGIVDANGLADYRYSSFWFLNQPKLRPGCLDVSTALGQAGGLADTPAGRQCYAEYLSWQATDGPAGKSKAYVSLSKGWALGSAGFKQALVKDHSLAVDARAWESSGVRELREVVWQGKLDQLLLAVSEKDKRDQRKSAPWKVRLAEMMKASTEAPNTWLAERLGMGSGAYLSKHVGLARRKVKGKA